MAKAKSRGKTAGRTRQKGARGVAARRAKRRRPAARKAKAARKTPRRATAARRKVRKPARAGAKTKARAGSKTKRAAGPKRRGVNLTATKPTGRAGSSAPGRAATAGRGTPAANPRGSSGPGTSLLPTKRSTGTRGGAGASRSPYLERERKRLRDPEEDIQGPPSSLDMDRTASAARSGREGLREALREHTESSPAFTGGDIDADWQNAYATGDEAPGGDNPTPDQDRVDDIGKALGLQYDDNEELKAVEKIAERDRHRWELDPASAEDYRDRQKK